MHETELKMSLELEGELNLEGSLEAERMYLRGPQGPKGDKGDKGDTGEIGGTGVGIESVIQTYRSTEDDGDNIITVTKTDGTTSTFLVQNGSKGDKGDKGDTGLSGVHTGPEAPTDPAITVWIDTSDETISGIAEESAF